jgi:hypothetical protein
VPGMQRGNFVTITTVLSAPALLCYGKRNVHTIEHFLLESCAEYKLYLTGMRFFSVRLNTYHRKSITEITFITMQFQNLD